MNEVLNGLAYLNLSELETVLVQLKMEIANRKERKKLAEQLTSNKSKR